MHLGKASIILSSTESALDKEEWILFWYFGVTKILETHSLFSDTDDKRAPISSTIAALPEHTNLSLLGNLRLDGKYMGPIYRMFICIYENYCDIYF